MPSHRTRNRPLPLVLSLVAHALLLAALWHFAPLAPARARDPEPVSVRLVARTPPPEEPIVPPRACDRRQLPAEPAAPLIQPEPRSTEELLAEFPAESIDFEVEQPATARRSVIGAGISGSLRVPHAQAPALQPVNDQPAAGSCAAAEDLTPPIPLDCPAPDYPAGAASVREHGRVRLEIRIDERGLVESVSVLHTSGFVRLDEAAVLGVRHWRFEPARREGVAVAWRLEHTILFRFEPASN
jgi:protein TonB